MEFVVSIVSIISLIVFFVMAVNISTTVVLLRSLLRSHDTTRKYERIRTKLAAGIGLTEEEKALLVEPAGPKVNEKH